MIMSKGAITVNSGDYILTRAQIENRVSDYNFSETGDILRFLSCVCGMQPDDCGYIYIRSKLGQCLSNHDDCSDYFIPLRELACELDFLVRRKLKVFCD